MGLGRLLLFTDQIYRRQGDRVTADRAFLLFIQALIPAFDRIVFLGRVDPEPGEAPYLCAPHPRFSFRELPYYPSLHSVRPLLKSIVKGVRAAWAAVGESDAVMLGIPNPWALLLWAAGRLRRRPVIFLVRQDLGSRVRLRSPGMRRALAMGAVRVLEALFVFLSRRTLTFTIGQPMFERYHRRDSPVHPMLVSLVPARDLDGRELRQLHPPPHRLLWVGRVHPDKNLEGLVEAIRGLACEEAMDLQVDLVGAGPAEQDIRDRVNRSGLQERVRFHGYVPQGPGLARLYREADLFVLPSHSEGFPQVLLEAAAEGLPIVATAVGGIRYLVQDGRDARLVPVRDPAALKAAIREVLTDAELYRLLSGGALTLARQHTLEAERDRLVERLYPYLSGARTKRSA